MGIPQGYHIGKAYYMWIIQGKGLDIKKPSICPYREGIGIRDFIIVFYL
jgi:hypothetical protein